MYQTKSQLLTLDRILGKSKANKVAVKHVKYAAKDKQRASAVLAKLTQVIHI